MPDHSSEAAPPRLDLPKRKTFVKTSLLGGTAPWVSLVWTSSSSAHAALRLFEGDDFDAMHACIHSAIAVEHIAKAYLLAVSPVLLADKNTDFDGLLHFAGHGKQSRTSESALKTVSGAEACRRVGRLLPDFQYVQSRDEAIFTARNSAAHAGFIEADAARASVKLMVKFPDPILSALDVNVQQYWSGRQELVAALKLEATEDLQSVITAKLEAARIRLSERLRSLPDDASRRVVLEAITGQGEFGEYNERYECPACKNDGVLLCWKEYGEVEVDFDRDGVPEGAYRPVTAYPYEFFCSACRLSLDEAETVALGMPDSFDLDPEPYSGDPEEV